MAQSGFTLGDHTFADPSKALPIARGGKPRQIRGAVPPTAFEGLLREAGPTSPAAAELRNGKFCGHGETTMTIFDVVINGQDVLEFSAITDEACEQGRGNAPVVVVRVPGEEHWTVVFRSAWEEGQQGLLGCERGALTAEESAAVRQPPGVGRVSIGFEYPGDARSRDDVSWLTLDFLPEGEAQPMCLIDAELA
jgi:hypothetical protein